MLDHHFADVDRVLLHVETDGEPGGEAVVLLHGWPDLAATFRPQLQTLAEHGYHALAPDQRGYGLSGKPPHVSDYDMPRLVEDIRHLIERERIGPVHLVGHDWGAAVAWEVAHRHPQLLRSLTIINCPHPDVMARALTRRPAQLLRSWYMLAFQIPGLAELVLEARGGAVLAAMLRHGAGLDDEQLAVHRAAWRQPGAIARPLFWYRALGRSTFRSLRRSRRATSPSETSRGGAARAPLTVPTRIFWGRRDRVFAADLVAQSAARCEPPASVRWLDARHWPHHDRPVEFDRLLRQWLAENRAPAMVTR